MRLGEAAERLAASGRVALQVTVTEKRLGSGAGEAGPAGRAQMRGCGALTASELEGFAWAWRPELLLRDQTLVLCLKAALTFERRTGCVRGDARG